MSKFQAEYPQQKFWPNIVQWLDQVNLQKEPEHHLVAIEDWFEAFLESEDADDHETRCEILQARNNMRNLFIFLSGFSHERRQSEIDKILSL